MPLPLFFLGGGQSVNESIRQTGNHSSFPARARGLARFNTTPALPCASADAPSLASPPSPMDAAPTPSAPPAASRAAMLLAGEAAAVASALRAQAAAKWQAGRYSSVSV